MKKIVFILFVLAVSFTGFAQKDEVKSAEKFYKKNNIVEAKQMIDKACQLKDQADDKTRARIFYNKARIYAKIGGRDIKNFEIALNAINQLKAFEKKIDKKRYSDDTDAILYSISQQVEKASVNRYKNKQYADAARLFGMQYRIGKNDYSKYSQAVCYLGAEDYKNALPVFKDLYNSKYTGVTEYYSVKNKEGKRERVANEARGKILVGSGEYSDLKKEKTPNLRPEIVANILYIYAKLGKDDEAIKFIGEAKKENPNNIDLIIGEGNYYLKKGDNVKFAAAMQKAVNLEPNNKIYNFNLATAYYQLKKYDEAKKYFETTLKLDPNYIAAYKGLAYVVLAPEEKITKEMNKDEVLMNDRLYNKYQKQQLDLYRQVLPILEKAYQVDNNDFDVVRMLKKIYGDLEMPQKAKEMRAKYKVLKAALKTNK